MPDLSFPETETKADVEPNAASIIADTIPAEGVVSENKLELPDTNDAAEIGSDDSASVDVDLTAASDIASNNDFDFGLDTAKPEAEAFNANSAEESNTLDLSGISLDVDEVASDESAATVSEPEATADSESDAATTIEESQKPESEDVDTKLDLIAAYLEMEDKIGAKELLDEVMKEGGPNQRKKAETLLSQIT
jgi:pilus assembly protein FimV